MNTKNIYHLSLAIICTILTLGIQGLSADDPNSGPPGKSPGSRLHKHTKPLDTRIFDQYEAVAEGLVRDNLDNAKNASSKLATSARDEGRTNIGNAASKVADAASLQEARAAFKTLSSQIIEHSQGNSEYTIMTCHMVEDGRWLQSDEKVSNPYMGGKMPECGMPESEKGKMMDGMKAMKKEHRPSKFK